MSKSSLVIVLLVTALCGCTSSKKQAGDPQIHQMLAEIDARRIEQDIRTLVSFGTRHTLSDASPGASRGIGAAREWIRIELEQYARESGGRLQVQTQEVRIEHPTERIPHVPVTIVNVLATLPGTQPQSANRVYIVSGHYDSRNSDVMDATGDAPGANDDASGTAAVMEMTRVMSRYRFDATIVFACVAGEEQGLNGAAGLAEKAKRDGWQVAGMFTNDIIGNTRGGNGMHDDSRVRVFSEGVPSSETPIQLQARQSVGGENDGPSRQLARYIKLMAQHYVPNCKVTLVFRRDRYGRGGDHIPFNRQGFAAVRFTEPNEDFSRQHQNVTSRNGKPYGDVPEYVDFNYVAKVARVNAAALANLARAPEPPRGATIDPNPSYDTTISWQPSNEPDVAGYAILVRDTTAADWQKRIDAGNVTRATIPKLSKDDYIFGVEAYDREGHRSPAASPLPRLRRATTHTSATMTTAP